MKHRRLLGWAALPLTDRRWGATLSAVALGFGLFVGVAISPSAAGTLATGTAPLLLEVVDPGGGEDPEDDTAAAEPVVASNGTAEPPVAMPSGFSASALPEPPAPPTDPPDPISPPAQTPAGGPADDEEAGHELIGTVVHVNPAAASYAVAEEGGALSVVHAGRQPRPGTEVEIPVRELANGTLAEAGRRQASGSARSATLLGTVTFVSIDSEDPAYVVSARGVSVVVRVHPEDDGTAPDLPRVGTLIAADVAIDESRPPTGEDLETTAAPVVVPPPGSETEPDCAPEAPLEAIAGGVPRERLWQRTVEEKGEPGEYAEFAAIVVAACPEKGLLAVSADDNDLLAARINLAVPAGIDLASLTVGSSVTATATIDAGAFALTGIASDERLAGADDAGTAQGDLRP